MPPVCHHSPRTMLALTWLLKHRKVAEVTAPLTALSQRSPGLCVDEVQFVHLAAQLDTETLVRLF
jgi:hypothetical protein